MTRPISPDLQSRFRNRQDAIEALDIAASGKVRVHYIRKPLSDLEATYKGMEKGEILGRVVLDVPPQ
jgi:alcohol dehydrogenase, propanol-preferring